MRTITSGPKVLRSADGKCWYIGRVRCTYGNTKKPVLSYKKLSEFYSSEAAANQALVDTYASLCHS